MRLTHIAASVHIGLEGRVYMPYYRVVDAVVRIFAAAYLEVAGRTVAAPAEGLLSAGGSAVIEDGQRPVVVWQGLAYGRHIHIYGFAVLDVRAAGYTVVAVEEAAVDACYHLGAFGTETVAKLGEGLADLRTVVVVLVGVGIRHYPV